MIKINKALKLGGNSRRVSSFNRCLMEHLLEIIALLTQMLWVSSESKYCFIKCKTLTYIVDGDTMTIIWNTLTIMAGPIM